MNIVVSSIVEVSMGKIALLIRISIDDWTPKRVIIARNAFEQMALKYFPPFEQFPGINNPEIT